MTTLYLFNTNIIPDAAVVRVQKISAEKARELVEKAPKVVSAIGHQGTVDALAALGIHTVVNRIYSLPAPFDQAISLKLNGRIEEGKILTLEDMEKIGYQLYLIKFFPSDYVITP